MGNKLCEVTIHSSSWQEDQAVPVNSNRVIYPYALHHPISVGSKQIIRAELFT